MEYTEKEVLGDALLTQKMATGQFDKCSNECVHEELRQTMLNLLKEEHDIAQEVFVMMHEKGYYPTPAAQTDKIAEVKSQFAQSVK